MPSAHYGMDNFLCTGGSHLTLNLVTEGVELTGQNKLALIRACPHTGGGPHHHTSHMSKLLTERALSAILLGESPGHDTSQALSVINLSILSRLDAYQEVVYMGIVIKIISDTPAASPVVTLCTPEGD